MTARNRSSLLPKLKVIAPRVYPAASAISSSEAPWKPRRAKTSLAPARRAVRVCSRRRSPAHRSSRPPALRSSLLPYPVAEPTFLDRARELGARESGLAVVVTTRVDGSPQASVVNAGVLEHPVTGEAVVGFVARGRVNKLANL